MFKKNVLYINIAMILSVGVPLSVQAAPCSVSGGTINVSGTASNCEITDADLTQVSIDGGAQVTHNITGNVTITNAVAGNANGLSLTGTGSSYNLITTGDLNITSGNSTVGSKWGPNGFGIVTGNGTVVTIEANNVVIKATNGAGTEEGVAAILAGGSSWIPTGGSIVNIFADNVTLSSGSKNTGTLHASSGTINIKGNNGLSLTTITSRGHGIASVAVGGVAATSMVNVELVDIKSGSSNYAYGMFAVGKNGFINFVGGDIRATGTGATGIRTMDLAKVTAKGYDNGRFNITTTSTDARAIRATGGSAVVINADQHTGFVTTIKTTGMIADGLNAGRLGTMHLDGSIHMHAGEGGSQIANSNITIYGQAVITTGAATSYGIHLIGDGASVKLLGVAGQGRSTLHSASTAVRFDFGNGYSLNPDGSSAKGQAQSVVLENVDITHDGKSGNYAFGKDNNGNFTYNLGHLIQVGDHTGDVGVGAQQATAGVNNNGAMTVANAVVNGQLTMKNSTATAVDGKDLLHVTYGGGTSFLTDKVSSSFTLNARNNTVLKGSIFTDTTLDKDGNASVLTLNLDNSEWHTIRDSNLTNLNLSNDAHVYIGDQSQTITAANKATLLIDTLSGSGIFHFRTDIKETGLQTINISDLIKVTGTASGNHGVQIKDNNTGNVDVTGNEIVTVAQIAAGDAKFYLANATGYVDMGAYRYGLDTNTATGDWFLSGTAAPVIPPVDPPPVDPPVVQPEPELTNAANHSVNIFNINYLLNNAETHTLLQRMGELRESDGLGGVWSRVYGGKFNGFGSKLQGFDFKYTGIQLGVDHLISNEYGRFYLGGMAGYSEGEAKYRVGTGDVKSYHLGLYTTFKHANGFYVDGLIKYNNMRNKFTTQTGGGYTVNGKGTTKGLSASLELGKRFYFQTKDNGWYIEPQAQVAYAHQGATTVRSSNQLKTRLDSVDSLIGRMSMIVGYKITDGANPIDLYFKTGVAKEFKGKTGYTFNNSGRNEYKLDGTWWDNAIGVNAQFDKKHNLYFDVNYAAGNKFDKAQLNLGYRYEF